MPNSSHQTRFNFIDHFRGLVIACVVLQHAVQGYARQWGGRLWFLDLPDRENWFDIVFMWTDGYIMQALFFAAGMFVFPSFYRRGLLSFIKEKALRLGVPLVFGVLVLVPPLTYLKYAQRDDPGIGYLEYWIDVFLQPGHFRVGGFWFLAMLLLFTFSAVILDKVLPFLKKWLASFSSWLCSRPIRGYIVVGGITAILISVSDIIWGTYWWIGLENLFKPEQNSYWHYVLRPFVARANMLYSYIFFFMLGIGIMQAGVLKDQKFLEKASNSWMRWLILLIILTVVYSWYNQAYLLDGAFSNELQIHFYYGGTWETAWDIIYEIAPGILIRTILHGFLCTAQIVTLLILLYRFTNENTGAWMSLGACSYGIYIFHEPCVLYTQYFFMESNLSNTLKMLVAFGVGLCLSWSISYTLRRLPVTRRIL